VFENFLHNYDDPQYLQTQATMTSTNDIIQQKSFEMVKCLSGEMVISNSIASMCKRCSFETSCMHHFNKESQQQSWSLQWDQKHNNGDDTKSD
jgi:hypothetical protein